MSGLLDKMKTMAAAVGAASVVGGYFVAFGQIQAQVDNNTAQLKSVPQAISESEQRLTARIRESEDRTREDIRDLRQRIGK